MCIDSSVLTPFCVVTKETNKGQTKTIEHSQKQLHIHINLSVALNRTVTLIMLLKISALDVK